MPIIEFILDTNWTMDEDVVIFDMPNNFNTSPIVEVTKKQVQDPSTSPRLDSAQDDVII